MFDKKLDSILGSISKNIDDLNVFAVQEIAKAEVETAEALKLQESAGARRLEVQRANRVSAKLAELIS